MARAQGARAQMALAFETVYGTAPAAGEFWQMPFASCNLGSEQNLLGLGTARLRPRSAARRSAMRSTSMATSPCRSTRGSSASG